MYLNVNWPGGNAVVDFFEEKGVGDNTDRSGSYNDPKVIAGTWERMLCDLAQ